MELRLKDSGRTFATRWRARQILEELPEDDAPEISVSLDEIVASPSFLAELYVGLLERYERVILAGLPDQQALAVRVAVSMGLGDRVVAAARAGG